MLTPNKFLIYGLFCPVTDSLHYVGKSSSAMFRPNQHLTDSHSEKINQWVQELATLNYKPIIKVLEYCEDEELLAQKEKFWIYKSIKDGCHLLNSLSITAASIILSLENDNKPANAKATLDGIAVFVRAQRKARGWKQEELAVNLGIGLKTVRKIEQSSEYMFTSAMRILSFFGAELIVKHRPNGL